MDPDNPLAIYSRNASGAQQLDSYQTPLSPSDEQQFQQWAAQNQQRIGPTSVVNNPFSDYDYRGWWQENKGSPAPDGHFTDKYKTPYHQSFSNESKYSIPDKAPGWKQVGKKWQLITPKGDVVFEE